MKIIILGANSQLGQSIKKISTKFPQLNLVFKSKQQLDLTQRAKVQDFFKLESYNAIINCAAYTNVDKAEEEKELANEVNHLAVENLAKIAKQHEIKLFHISTDYVFDGAKTEPYSEDEETLEYSLDQSWMPVSSRTASIQPSFYGLTKLAGEKAVQQVSPNNSAIIRTSWLYSEFGNNFVKTISKKSATEKELKVVTDQTGSPTNAQDLAEVLLNLVENHKSNGVEIYHYANEGICTFNEFAIEIVKQKNKSTVVTEIKTAELNQKANRPKYSALNTTKIKTKYKIKIPNWKDSLKKCLSYL